MTFFVGLANLVSHSFAFARATAHESVLTGYWSLEFVSTNHPTHTRLIATFCALQGMRQHTYTRHTNCLQLFNPNFASLKSKTFKNFTLLSCDLFKVFKSLYLMDGTKQKFVK